MAAAAIGFWIAWTRGLAAQTIIVTAFDTVDDLAMVNSGFHPAVVDLANAIAWAEGYGTPNAAPTRANNPGDLKLGDRGYGVTGTEGVTVFPSAADGWDHLYRQLQLIVDGRSHVYTLDDSIQTMANRWTDTTSGDWARNVVAYLRDHGYPRTTVDTPLTELL